MLTTQEAIEAMAGRSPDGKPLVFVSQQDYDTLRKQYEALLKTTRKAKWDWRLLGAWAISVAALGISIAASAYKPDTSAHVEPYAGGFYTSSDVAGVHAANAFCMARKEEKQTRALHLVASGGLFFECVKSDDEVAADKREAARKDAEPWQFAPSAENRRRCIELRDQRTEAANAPEAVGYDAIMAAAQKAEKIEDEANTLKCWIKP